MINKLTLLIVAVVTAAICMFAVGCKSALTDDPAVTYEADITATPTAEPTETRLPAPVTHEPTEAPAPTETTTPTETPEPTPQTASLGFGGDVLIMTGQIEAAYDRSTDTYDFKDTFLPMQGMFESVDMTILNFEGTCAGKEAGYTQPRPTAEPATSENPDPKRPMQRFNAPDELVSDLMELGVDGFSTANNHCLDMGSEGLIRTIDVMDSLGAFHTGAYKSEEDAQNADIVEINGIRIGFVSMTHSVNGFDWVISSEQSEYMVTRLYWDNMVKARIADCREQGAEFVIALVHWGEEYMFTPNNEQKSYAAKLIEWGADIIIGCHPHVVQPIEWVTAERGGEQVTAPVVYSMGNFVSNISRSHEGVDIGLFVTVELLRNQSGNIVVSKLDYIPIVDIVHSVSDGRYLHEVFPCLPDMTGIYGVDGMSDEILRAVERARELCERVVGNVTVD